MENTSTMTMNQNKPTLKVFGLPSLFILGFLSLLYVPRVQANEKLFSSFIYAGGALIVWMIWLAFHAAKTKTQFKIEPRLVRVHWVQALVHTSLYAYWGYYWRPVYDYAPLLLAQILFSYAFVAFLSWSRGKSWANQLRHIPDYFLNQPFPLVQRQLVHLPVSDDCTWLPWQRVYQLES